MMPTGGDGSVAPQYTPSVANEHGLAMTSDTVSPEAGSGSGALVHPGMQIHEITTTHNSVLIVFIASPDTSE
jgi:hypothetical protein